MIRILAILFLASSLLAAAPPCAADVFIVVPAGNPVSTITQKQVTDIFMGRNRAFPDGGFAVPFDLPRDGADHAAFYLALTGWGPSQVNSYWARLMFSGQVQPPVALAGEQAMAETVRRNPRAIGYLHEEPSDKGLRVILVLKEPR